MHDIEPFYNWQYLYNAEEDELSPFYGVQHSEFEFSNTVYNFYIHPQWDEFGSKNLYLKVLFADYDFNFVIIEMIGEWNDAVENDIMTLKREVVDLMINKGITKYILITENILNFHSGDQDYYEEWINEITDDGGWIALINMPEHSMQEFKQARLSKYINFFETLNWRTFRPHDFFNAIDNKIFRTKS